MNTQIGVPVFTELFLELAEFLREKGDQRDPVVVVDDAIRYWMENADWKPELIAKSDVMGYQWKSLFLPDGTQIRMQYKSKYFYAVVQGDEIIYEGQPITPGRLANTIADSSRNAWRDLWIKLPDEKEWAMADDCRARAQAAAARVNEVLEKELGGLTS